MYKASALSRVVDEQGVNADGGSKPTTAHERVSLRLLILFAGLFLSANADTAIPSEHDQPPDRRGCLAAERRRRCGDMEGEAGVDVGRYPVGYHYASLFFSLSTLVTSLCVYSRFLFYDGSSFEFV